MKLNPFLLLCLTGLVPGAVSIQRPVPRKYDLIMTPMTWQDAQNYCRMKYTDLAIITSDTDWLRFKKVLASKGVTANTWIGLYNDINSWRWSLNDFPLKNSTYTNWYPGNPDNYFGHEACGYLGMCNKWWDVSCAAQRPFICYNANFTGSAKFIGVTSPWLTWSGAQAYCRTHHTDLASSLNSSDQTMLETIRNIQDDSWFGLYRDTWKWSDGTNGLNIPWASGQPDNYGGISNCAVITNGAIDDVTCTNLYPFFCHTNFPTRSQTVRLQVKSDGSVLDPAVQASILEQVKQKLEENGMLENTTVTWKVQPDGNIFHKKKKDGL